MGLVPQEVAGCLRHAGWSSGHRGRSLIPEDDDAEFHGVLSEITWSCSVSLIPVGVSIASYLEQAPELQNRVRARRGRTVDRGNRDFRGSGYGDQGRSGGSS